MPTIHMQMDLAGADPGQVWPVACDSERLGSLAEHVLGVQYLEPGNEGRQSSWRVLLDGGQVGWVQQESTGPGLRMRFEQVSGDFDTLTGTWDITAVPQGARVSLTIEFELGIDGLAPLLEPIWAQALQVHAAALLSAIARITVGDGKQPAAGTGVAHISEPVAAEDGLSRRAAYFFDFMGTAIQFSVSEAASDPFEPVHWFFRHSISGQQRRAPDFRIDVDAYDPAADVAEDVWRSEQHVI
ncbi:MAG TPA: SRPBCC family protein, partial [Streptosporangiaceae bacterium]|nr:SRPBCC family protein [Streptosporangiaceae bacterium]